MPNNVYAFGDLNPVLSPSTARGMDPSMSVMDILREVILAHYTTNAIQGTGPYKGYVLRVEEDMDQNNPAPGNWLSTVFGEQGIFDGLEAPKVLKRYKVRIPEIHVTLPIPARTASSPTESGGHQAIIDMYPTFVAMTSNTEIAAPGDLVWVDYGHRGNFEDPTFVGPIFPPTEQAPRDNTPPSESHRDPCIPRPSPTDPDPTRPPQRRRRGNPDSTPATQRQQSSNPSSGAPIGGGQQEYVSDDPAANWMYRSIRDISRHNNRMNCRSRGANDESLTTQRNNGCTSRITWGAAQRHVMTVDEYFAQGGRQASTSGRFAAGSCKDISNLAAKYMTALRIAVEDQAGRPYSWGGKAPWNVNKRSPNANDDEWHVGIDCSGFARVVRVNTEGLMHENGILGNAYDLCRVTKDAGTGVLGRGRSKAIITGTSSDVDHWTFSPYRNPSHRYSPAENYDPRYRADYAEPGQRTNRAMWGGNKTNDGYTWFSPCDAVVNGIDVKDPTGQLYKDFVGKSMRGELPNSNGKNVSFKDLSETNRQNVHIMPGDYIMTGSNRSRGSNQHVTHVVLAFCGPSGELRIAESGGPYNGTGSRLASEWIERQSRRTSPRGVYIWQPPEWGRVWASVGGRPNQAWTPELCRQLAGEEYFGNIRGRAVASGDAQPEVRVNSPRLGFGAPVRVAQPTETTSPTTAEDSSTSEDVDVVSAEEIEVTSAEESLAGNNDNTEAIEPSSVDYSTYLSSELQQSESEGLEYVDGNYSQAECNEMLREAFRSIESPAYNSDNTESRQFWGEITAGNIVRQMALDFALSPAEYAEVLRCGCSQRALMSTVSGQRAVAVSQGIRNAFRNCPPDVDPPYGMMFGRNLPGRMTASGSEIGATGAGSAAETEQRAGGANPAASRAPSSTQCQNTPGGGGGGGRGGGGRAAPQSDPTPLTQTRGGNQIGDTPLIAEFGGPISVGMGTSRVSFPAPLAGMKPDYFATRGAVRVDAAPTMQNVVNIVTELGGALSSAGTGRPLGTPGGGSRSNTSFHYTNLALDAQTNTMGNVSGAGIARDNFVVEWNPNQARRFIVWVRSNMQSGEVTRTANGNTVTFRVEHKRIEQAIIRPNCSRGLPAIAYETVEGYFINLTEIMAAHGADGISPIRDWPNRCVSIMDMEGWHFDFRHNAGLVIGQSTFKHSIETAHGANAWVGTAVEPHVNKVWRGGSFR